MWMKWHHTFAWGHEKEEHWRELPGVKTKEEAKGAAKEECEELMREYEWSDKYRGIDYEIVDLPPADVLRRFVKNATAQILRWTEEDKYLRGLLAKAEERETKAS